MRKFLLTALVAVMSAGIASAQMPTTAEVQASVERYHKLQALEKPASVGLSNVDALANKAETTAKNSVEISMLLERAAGTSPEANAQVPLSSEEYSSLAVRINQEQKDIKGMTDMVGSAANDVKGANPMAKIKSTKSLSYSQNVISIATAEAAYHTKTMAGIAATIGK